MVDGLARCGDDEVAFFQMQSRQCLPETAGSPGNDDHTGRAHGTILFSVAVMFHKYNL